MNNMKIKKSDSAGVSSTIGSIVSNLKKQEPKSGVDLLSIATKLSNNRKASK